MCGGGGSTTTQTYDPVYNAGLLEIAQEDQQFKREFINMFKYGVTYDPTAVQRGAYVDGKWVNEENLPTVQKEVQTEQRSRIKREDYQHPDRGTRYWGGLKTETQTATDPLYQIETRTLGEARGYDSGTVSEMDYLQQLVEANADLLDDRKGVERAELGLSRKTAEASTGLVDDRAEAERAGLFLSRDLSRSRAGLLPLQTNLTKKQIDATSSFIDEAKKGVNANEWMDQAQAGVQHGFKNARKAMRMDIGSYGLDPSAGRYASQNRELAMSEASGVAGARTEAKRAADAEDFRRKQVASGLTVPKL